MPWSCSVRGGRPGRGAGAAIAIALGLLLGPASVSATPPGTPTITSPLEGQTVHPADVHMEATGFSDADGDTHRDVHPHHREKVEVARRLPGPERPPPFRFVGLLLAFREGLVDR